MKPVFWTPPAEADLTEIDDYWWSVDPDVADRLTERIRAAAEFLRSLPQGGVLIDQTGARKWRAPQTPYLLAYRLRAETVEILRVYHERQDRNAP